MTKDKQQPKPAKRTIRRPPITPLPIPKPAGCTCTGHVGIHSTVGCMRTGCTCTRGAL